MDRGWKESKEGKDKMEKEEILSRLQEALKLVDKACIQVACLTDESDGQYIWPVPKRVRRVFSVQEFLDDVRRGA